MKETKLIILCLLIGLLLISSAAAITLSGNISSTETQVRNYTYTTTGSTTNVITGMVLQTAPATAGLQSIVCWENEQATFDAGAPSSATTSINITYGVNTIGTGTYGYNRLYNALGVEQKGYTWINLNSWNVTPLPTTGSVILNLSYTRSNVYNISNKGSKNPSMTDGMIGFTGGSPPLFNSQLTGDYLYIQIAPFAATYTATKPSGLGIQGSINKMGYQSWAGVYNATSRTLIASDGSYNNATFNFNTPAETIFFSVRDSLGYYHNTTNLFNTSIPVTPTSTQSPSGFSLSLNYTYPRYNEAILGTILYNGVPATSAQIRAVDWVYRDASLAPDTNGQYTNNINYLEGGTGTKQLNYGWNGTKFIGWDTSTQLFSNDKGTSLPNALNLYTLLAGEVTVQVQVYPVGTGAPEILTQDITVLGTGSMYTLVIHAVDWQSGSIIGGSTISIQEKLGNTWSNVTTDDSGYRSVTYASGTPLKIVATATGYVSDFLNYQVFGNDFVNIQLYKTGTGETNVSRSMLLVRTFQRNDLGQIQPLSGVTVTLSDAQVKTSSAGVAQFSVLNNTAISINAYKSGFISATKTVTPSSNLTTATLYLYSTSSTLVPTPFPTATATIRPTQTAQGNLSTCQVLSANATVVDVMRSNIACWGVTDLEGQNFSLAALIILICALALGKIGKGDGAAIGAIIGFIFSFAMHLIPFYLLVLAFALIAAFFANKFMGGK